MTPAFLAFSSSQVNPYWPELSGLITALIEKDMEPMNWSSEEVMQWVEVSGLGVAVARYVQDREMTGLELVR